MSFNFSSLGIKMDKVLDHVIQDFSSLRTGKANAQILDSVIVEAYGSHMKVVELATIQVVDPTLLTVTPWDKSVLAQIERAISIAGLNLNPVVNGDSIRIQIAPLTEEKRKEMVKVLYKKIEDGKVMLRSVRTDAKKEIEAQKGEEGISEDLIKSELEQLEEFLKKHIARLEEIAVKKEKELMTI